MSQLEPLQSGDIVDVIAPGFACKTSDLKRSLRAIRAMGLIPRVPPDLFGKRGMFSNRDEVRLKHLRKSLYAPDSKLVWCVRGGYGSLRLLPQIQKWKKPKQRKIFLGYSDVTTLHAYFNQSWKWPTLHGPMVERIGREIMTATQRRELWDILFGRTSEVQFRNLKACNSAARKTRRLRASVYGGNLTVLLAGLKTASELNPRGRILFFEDIGERPYRVDRMLTQLEQIGWFKNCKAVVFGDFLLGDAKDRRALWSDVVARFASAQRIPVLSGVDVGHNPKIQRTLPFATSADLRLGSSPQLIVATGIRSERA